MQQNAAECRRMQQNEAVRTRMHLDDFASIAQRLRSDCTAILSRCAAI
jgi:hypothetical protein